MRQFSDVNGRAIRLSDERQAHLETDHLEMRGQMDRIGETLQSPELIVKSRSDPSVDLYYRLYDSTPVTRKYLCVVVKNSDADGFVVTAYFTDATKKGTVLWPKR